VQAGHLILTLSSSILGSLFLRRLSDRVVTKALKAMPDGSIHIERINGSFIYQLKGTPAEYKARLNLAIANGWLWLHESGTYVRFTEDGSALLA
jgi:hypothetical protein